MAEFHKQKKGLTNHGDLADEMQNLSTLIF